MFIHVIKFHAVLLLAHCMLNVHCTTSHICSSPPSISQSISLFSICRYGTHISHNLPTKLGRRHGSVVSPCVSYILNGILAYESKSPKTTNIISLRYVTIYQELIAIFLSDELKMFQWKTDQNSQFTIHTRQRPKIDQNIIKFSNGAHII